MKFTKEIISKAWKVYGEIKKAHPAYSHRLIWKLAIKDTIRFFKSLQNGFIEFFKIPKSENSDVEVTKRRIGSLELLGYETPSGQSSLFTVVDLDKVDQGLKNVVISFHNFQMI